MFIMHVRKIALRGNCRQNVCETSFSPFGILLISTTSSKKKNVGSKVLWHLWIGMARKPGPSVQHVAVEVFNVGGWLVHGDMALDVQVDFLAVVEHR